MIRKLLIALCALTLAACTTSPLGRKQLQLFPDAQIDQMGVASYAQIKEQTPAATSGKANDFVLCVADHVTREVPAAYGIRDWEVTVFESDQVNAFALPGGKIGVYTGLLKVTENQDQLAAVIGHEIAHVLAKHSNERISTAFATQQGLELAKAVSGAPSPTKDQLFGLLGLGAQVGIILPFSRTQESEADLLGLDLMAKAGFNPQASVKLWQNMGKLGGQTPPEFLSTHPSGERRIRDLQQRMSKAQSLYRQAQMQGKRPRCVK